MSGKHLSAEASTSTVSNSRGTHELQSEGGCCANDHGHGYSHGHSHAGKSKEILSKRSRGQDP